MSGELDDTHIADCKNGIEMNSSLKDKHRNQILESAREIVLADPKSKLKAHEVAKRANIARTSLYEHFDSINELMGELLLTELMNFSLEIRQELSNSEVVAEVVTNWTNLNLNYFADGRHALVRALMPAAMNSAWRDEIRKQHIKLYEELKLALAKSGYELSPLRFELITAVLEAAAKRVESSDAPEQVRSEAIGFINKALA